MVKMTEEEARLVLITYLLNPVNATKGVFEFNLISKSFAKALSNDDQLEEVLKILRNRELKGKIKEAVDILWEPFKPLDIKALAKEMSKQEAEDMIWNYVSEYHYDYKHYELVEILVDYMKSVKGRLKDEAETILEIYEDDENAELQAAAMVVLRKVRGRRKK